MYNPYQFNPYQFAPAQQVQQRTEIARVNGEAGANAYNLAPNSSILLLDEMNPIIYLKTTDSGGYPSVIAYQIAPYQKEEQTDIKSLESRIARLEGLVSESNTTTTKRSNKTTE